MISKQLKSLKIILFAIKHSRLGGEAESCEHSGIPLSIDCGEKVINIKHAAYGVYSNDNTCGLNYDGNCVSKTSLQV